MKLPLYAALKCWLEPVLCFFYPERCQLCGDERATAAEGYVCARCGSRGGGVRFIAPPFCERCGLPYAGDIITRFECNNCREMELHFDSARAAVVATGVALEVIHRYKYQRALWFEPFLVELLRRQAETALRQQPRTLLVPVPLHPLKKREREFNQAERLASRLSASTGVPMHAGLLRRVTPTRTQTMLSRAERVRNVRSAFAVRPGVHLHGEHVVLVDDVLTTGATTSACARALKAAGAGEVRVWTVARGL